MRTRTGVLPLPTYQRPPCRPSSRRINMTRIRPRHRPGGPGPWRLGFRTAQRPLAGPGGRRADEYQTPPSASRCSRRAKPPACADDGRVWADAEYLLGWVKGDPVPAARHDQPGRHGAHGGRRPRDAGRQRAVRRRSRRQRNPSGRPRGCGILVRPRPPVGNRSRHVRPGKQHPGVRRLVERRPDPRPALLRRDGRRPGFRPGCVPRRIERLGGRLRLRPQLRRHQRGLRWERHGQRRSAASTP